ncbi:MAG: rod shape-determining protein MreC [Anaerolineae bacterium]|nr:rod shape-determining protein MreC [Anaerolineae bacterium]
MTATRNRQLYIGIVLAILLLGFALDRLGYLSPVRAYVQSVLAPVQQAMTSVGQEVDASLEQTQSIQALQAQNAELEALNNKLAVENVRLREVERENQLLRQLLNFTRSNPQFNYQPTTVKGRSIGVDPTNLLFFVYVDVGMRDGVAKDMPVVTERGLVGRVTAVGPNSAQVLMLIDPASAVNAIIQNSRATGIVRGNLDGTLLMERIPQNETVNPGDIVLTSGLGGNFPDKLVIGQVTQVIQRDQDMFQSARIRPTVDFGELEAMLIITSFEPVDFEAEIQEAQEGGQ